MKWVHNKSGRLRSPFIFNSNNKPMATLSKTHKAQQYDEVSKELEQAKAKLKKYRELYYQEWGRLPDFDEDAESNLIPADHSGNYGVRNGELEERLKMIEDVDALKAFSEGEDRVTANDMIDARVKEIRRHNSNLSE